MNFAIFPLLCSIFLFPFPFPRNNRMDWKANELKVFPRCHRSDNVSASFACFSYRESLAFYSVTFTIYTSIKIHTLSIPLFYALFGVAMFHFVQVAVKCTQLPLSKRVRNARCENKVLCGWAGFQSRSIDWANVLFSLISSKVYRWGILRHP